MLRENRSARTAQPCERVAGSVRMSDGSIALCGGENLLRDKPEIDPAVCWQAIYSRDRRFDARFFAGPHHWSVLPSDLSGATKKAGECSMVSVCSLG
jgi:hypothetical protein